MFREAEATEKQLVISLLKNVLDLSTFRNLHLISTRCRTSLLSQSTRAWTCRPLFSGRYERYRDKRMAAERLRGEMVRLQEEVRSADDEATEAAHHFSSIQGP